MSRFNPPLAALPNCPSAALKEFTAGILIDDDGNVIDDPALLPPPDLGPVPGPEQGPFTAEIDSLRLSLRRLQHAFSRTTSIDDHLRLASAISLITTSISRLVRAQNHLTPATSLELNREIKAALEVVMKEWSPAA